MEDQGEYKVDREKDTESISFKKVKNNNAANDSFAANHVTYLTEAQINWVPSEHGEMMRNMLLSPEARMNALDRQASYYKKVFAYKDLGTLIVSLDREFPYPEYTEANATIVGFLSPSEELLEGKGILVKNKDKVLTIELYVDIDPKKIYYVVFLASAKPKKEDDTKVV